MISGLSMNSNKTDDEAIQEAGSELSQWRIRFVDMGSVARRPVRAALGSSPQTPDRSTDPESGTGRPREIPSQAPVSLEVVGNYLAWDQPAKVNIGHR
jgi:hypothetical protein